VRGGDFSCEAETCRGRDLSCEAETCRGVDLSCEAETCHGGSSNGKLVGDAANWSKTGRLASVDLDQVLFSSLS
jgi:hypothetical protein